MSNIEYKGYVGSIEANTEDGTLYGKLLYIRDLVTYEATTVPELANEFHFSVNEYLKDYKALGKQPDKPFKGSFNVRTNPQLHRRAALMADENNKKLNAFVCEAIEEKLERMGGN